MVEVSGLHIRGILARLRDAGQGSLPGGGAEILSARVRKRISPKKGGPEAGSTCTGGPPGRAALDRDHDVRPRRAAEDVLEHLDSMRALQDETGGFTAFVPWSYKPDNTPLEKWVERNAGPNAYLRMLAVARCNLDNFHHVQASWFSEGKKTGQVALQFGADDFGGTLFEENVHKAADYVNTIEVEERWR